MRLVRGAVTALACVLTRQTVNSQISPILVGKQGTEYKYIIAPENGQVSNAVEVRCFPLKMCIRVSPMWFVAGVPMVDFLWPGPEDPPIQSGNAFQPIVDAGELPPFQSLNFAKAIFTDLIDWNNRDDGQKNVAASEAFQVLTTCPAWTTYRPVGAGADQKYEFCIDLRTALSRRCVDMFLSDNNNLVIFRSSLLTNVTENGNRGNTNFRIPMQCSYPLQYNLDLFMGTYRTPGGGCVGNNCIDDPNDPNGPKNPDLPVDSGEVEFTPPGGGSRPNCSDIGIADFENDPVCTNDPGTDPNNPGFYVPELGLFEIITILTPNGQSLGKFPVYMFIYETDQYLKSYQNPPILDETLGLYVETGLLNPIEGAVLSTRECWATPTPDRNADKFMLVENFCLNPTAVQQIELQGITDNGEQIKNRFQGKVFQFVSSDKVYLFCAVRVCFPSTMPFGQTCSKMATCGDAGEPVRDDGTTGDVTRRKRSVELEPIPDEAESQDFVLELPPLDIKQWIDLGIPVVIINPKLLIDGESEIFGNTKVSTGSIEDSMISQWIYILMITGCIVVVMLLAVFAYNFVKTKKYQT